MANIFSDFLKGAAQGGIAYLANEQDAKLEQDRIRAQAVMQMQAQDLLEERRLDRERRIAQENAAILARSNPFSMGMALGGLGSATGTPAGATPGIESTTQATSAPTTGLQVGDTLTVPPAEGDILDAFAATAGKGAPTAGGKIEGLAPSMAEMDAQLNAATESPGVAATAPAQAPRSIVVGDVEVTAEDWAIAQRKLLGKGGEFVSPDAVMGEAMAEARRRQERQDSLDLRRLMAENTIANTKAATALREQQAGTRTSPDDIVVAVTSNNLPVYPDIITATTKQSQAAQETAAKEARAYVGSEKAIARTKAVDDSVKAAANALSLAEAAGADSPNIKMALAGDKAVSVGLFGTAAAEALAAYRQMELSIDLTGQGAITENERFLIRQTGPAVTSDGQVNINILRRKAALLQDVAERERLVNSAVTAYQNTSVREKILKDANELRGIQAASPILRVGDKVIDNPAYISSVEMIQAKAAAQQNGEEFDIKDFAAAKVRDAINTASQTVLGPLVDQAQKDGIIGSESEERRMALEAIQDNPAAETAIRKEFERMFRKPL